MPDPGAALERMEKELTEAAELLLTETISEALYNTMLRGLAVGIPMPPAP